MAVSEKNNAVKSVIADTVGKAIVLGVNVLFANSERIEYPNSTSLCSGYFVADTKNKSLGVAAGGNMKQWLPVLLHESSHMDQWQEDSPEWQEIYTDKGEDVAELFFNWIDDKNSVHTIAPSEMARRLVNVELDCERRTLEKVVSYGLQEYIDPEEYIMKANSYIYFYLYAMRNKIFYTPGYEPYNNYMIWMLAPKTFDNDYTKIPKVLHDAFKRHI